MRAIPTKPHPSKWWNMSRRAWTRWTSSMTIYLEIEIFTCSTKPHYNIKPTNHMFLLGWISQWHTSTKNQILALNYHSRHSLKQSFLTMSPLSTTLPISTNRPPGGKIYKIWNKNPYKIIRGHSREGIKWEKKLRKMKKTHLKFLLLRGEEKRKVRKRRPSPWVTPKIMEMTTILIKLPVKQKLVSKESSWIKVSNHYLGATETDFLTCSSRLDSPRGSTTGVTEDYSNKSKNSWKTVLKVSLNHQTTKSGPVHF